MDKPLSYKAHGIALLPTGGPGPWGIAVPERLDTEGPGEFIRDHLIEPQT